MLPCIHSRLPISRRLFVRHTILAKLSCALVAFFFSTPVFAQGLICPPVQVVFAVDTSGSMNDEALALCNSISQVESGLAANGVSATAFLYGITEDGQQAGSDFSCLTDSVANAVGSAVPGTNLLCGTTLDQSESWGEAVSILSADFPWAAGAVRIVIPISDEAACDGGGSCADPGNDRDAVDNAIALAVANSVFVSPIAGTDSADCVKTLEQDLAAPTGGLWFESTDPNLDLVAAIESIILSACIASNNPPTANCQDIIVNSDENCQGTGSVDNGSFDTEGGQVTIEQLPAGPYPVGTTQVTLNVTDNGQLTSSCQATVTVLPEKADGSSCEDTGPVNINCTNIDSSETLFTLDGNTRKQLRLTKRLLRIARQLGAKSSSIAALETRAEDASLAAWTNVWTNPTTVLGCEQSAACTTTSLSDVKAQTVASFGEGLSVAELAANLVRKYSPGKILPKRASRIIKNARKLASGSAKQVNSLSSEQTQCDTTQVNIVSS